MKPILITFMFVAALLAGSATLTTSRVEAAPNCVTIPKDAMIPLDCATWDYDTIAGLECWKEDRKRQGYWICADDDAPPIEEWCYIEVTYTCGCVEWYQAECTDDDPMSFHWTDSNLIIEDYTTVSTDECDGETVGDVVLRSDGFTLPAEFCPRSSR